MGSLVWCTPDTMAGSRSCAFGLVLLLTVVTADDGNKKVNNQEALAGTVLGAESETIAQIMRAEATVKATQDKITPSLNHILQLKDEKKSLEAAIEHLRPQYVRTYQPVISIGNELLKSQVQQQSLEVDLDLTVSDLPELERQTVAAESALRAVQHRLAALKLKLNPDKTLTAAVAAAPLFSVMKSDSTEHPDRLHDATTVRHDVTASAESGLA